MTTLQFLAGGGEMGARMRALDWTKTPVGPVEKWPPSLKLSLRIMLNSLQPIWIGWGEELVYFYNDAYKSIIGGRHPHALGRPAAEVWPETWSQIGPMLHELHGGTVEVRSHGLGYGSEFIVKLPTAKTEAVAMPAADTTASAPTSLRILVADDNHDAADSLAMILEMTGHDVRVVHDGRAALSVAQTFRPDAALLDIGMPQLNGYEVARALRHESWGTGITLMALTGWGQEGDRKRAIEAGFDRHLTKPIDPDGLEALLSGGARSI